MKVYTVHLPRDPENAAFVKEGMAWPCLVIPVLWMLWHRMWVPAAVVFACSLAIAAIGKVGGDPLTANLIGIGFQLVVAMEANNMRRWSLAKVGYEEVAVVAADNLTEAELRFFALANPALLAASDRQEPATVPRISAPGQPRAPSPATAAGPPLGVFPEASSGK